MLVNLNGVLKKAQTYHYGVGLFNTTDTDMLEAAISAAEEEMSPIVIGTAEVLLPYGELKLIGPAILAAARSAKVPVVVHLDHGLSYDRCLEALQLGFSSIMYDGSLHDPATNIANTREIVRIAHAMGATVEAEIGHVGLASEEDGASQYTTVEEALSFLEATNVDALAIAIGTAHGPYKTKPKLDLERLSEIRAATDVPLVLHGGSGLSDEDFRNVISRGIAKVNIFTDLTTAGSNAMRDGLDDGQGYLELRNMKKDAIKAEVAKKLRLFGSSGRA